jgi:hypothetical protein
VIVKVEQQILTSFASETSKFLVHSTHAWIINTVEVWYSTLIIGSLIVNLGYSHLPDFIRVKKSELNSANFVKLDVRLGERLSRDSTHFLSAINKSLYL